ncbi:hypothetical protein [Acidithiobacillus sp. AMEEHan]|uniref:hypothetical protein n=1 Tax=Acidithiobacillus sp. AMEEHan TaxID=2994951 RepID=UPI0027E59499|nr:hypothetical protein [Acidithiobacillus sp. AMEEHan]
MQLCKINKAVFYALIFVIGLFGGNPLLAESIPAYDCPAAAKSIYAPDFDNRCNVPNSPWSPVCRAIHTYKPKDWTDNPGLLASTVHVAFLRSLRQAGVDTPYCKALIDSEEPFERKLIACGNNGPCAVKVMGERSWQLRELEEKFTGPQLTQEALEDFLGKDARLPVGSGETLEERSIRGLSISPLPHASLAAQGLTLSWGFEPHNAQVQTVVFSNQKGQVLALALVDGLYAQGETAQQLPASARLRLFVRNPQQLSSLLSALQGWAAADALGMNVDCSKVGNAVCTRWSQYSMPITIYHLPCSKGKLAACRLPAPKPKGNIPSLEIFRQ